MPVDDQEVALGRVDDGELRPTRLSLFLAEAKVVLLDDPESELDPRWIGRVLSLAPETSQVVVTACRPLSETPGRYREIAMESLVGPAREPASNSSQVEAR